MRTAALIPHDLLRTLVEVVDGGGRAQGAQRVHRSQAAVSLQMKRLEELIGQPLFRKEGRRQLLTAPGETLVDYARRIVALNAEAAEAMRGNLYEGRVSLGAPQDLAEDLLPRLLQRFAARFPRVVLDVRVERNQTLARAVHETALDVILLLGDRREVPGTELAREKLVWIGARALAVRSARKGGEPLPLALLEPPCLFRTRALAALDAANIPYRVAYTTTSLTGLRAAVAAGLGLTARIHTAIDRELALTPIRSGLPALKTTSVLLWQRPGLGAAGVALAQELGDALRGAGGAV
jgi:DNA-binding transcriptional LysR family regulator